MKTNKRLGNCAKFKCPTCQNTTVPEIQQEYLSRLIEDTYGSPEGLAQCLDLAIEMLFYIEADTFDKSDVQNVVSALRGIILVLREQE